MDAFTNYGELIAPSGIGLANGSVLRMRNARNMQVRVKTGMLWITQEDDIRDIVLEPGGSFRLDRHGIALLTGCDPSALTLISIASES